MKCGGTQGPVCRIDGCSGIVRRTFVSHAYPQQRYMEASSWNSGASGKRYRSCGASCGQNPGRKQDIAHSAACSQKQAQAWNGMSMCPLSPAVNAAVMAELTKRLAAAAAVLQHQGPLRCSMARCDNNNNNNNNNKPCSHHPLDSLG